MDHTFVDEKSVKSFEEYVVTVGASMKSIETLCNLEKHAIKIGILTEDQAQRAGAICSHLHKLMELYYHQAESVFELLPPDFNPEATINMLKAKSLTKARSMLRKPKEKKCDI